MAALEAAEIHLNYFTKDTQVADKEVSHDKVTIADIEAEKLIIARIRERFPEHNLIGEEGSYGATESEYAWIIDPLDGTINYAKNLPHFCVSIGLVHQGKPAVGVVYDPMRKELFAASAGSGASLNGQTIRVSSTPDLTNSLLYTGFYYDRGKNMRKTLRQIEMFFKAGVIGVRRSGSAALDLCYVASGRGDGFWEHTLNIWDTAASMVILQEAGGRLTDWAGRFPGIGKSSIAASNGTIHEKILSLLKK